MDALDKRIQALLNSLKTENTRKMRGDCPPDNLLTSYIDQRLREAEKEKMERHLLLCNDCFDLFILSNKVKQEEASEALPATPSSWTNNAKRLFFKKKPPGFFDIVLKLTKETTEVISNSAKLIICPEVLPLLVRGNQEKPSQQLVFRKTFSDTALEIEIERTVKNRVNVRLSLQDIKPGSFSTESRVTLFNPEREIMSSPAIEDVVHFPSLQPGGYVIKITRQGKEIGRIVLKLQE